MKKIFSIDIFRDLAKGQKIMRLVLFRRWVLCKWEYDVITEEWY